MIADLALVPVIPSPLDIWASVGIRKAIEDAAEINENLKSRLVVNQCQPNTSLTKDILDLLPEFGITMAQSQFHQRTVYRQSAVFGQTVQDFGAKALLAISEVEMLCDEVLDLLNRKSSRKQS
jgi:chromosome partitioning protein